MSANGVAVAYDRVAAEYDTLNQVDAWVRHLLWNHYSRLFEPGDRVLDVSCGTGIDAIFLARRGIRVTGIDISAGMIARLREKVEQEGLEDAIDAHVMDVGGLAAWRVPPFDGIISAFAGLNTQPDLSLFARDAVRLLRPRGRLVLHLLNRFSLWEWLALLSRGRLQEARTLNRIEERSFKIGGQAVKHYLLSPAESYQRFFAPYFRVRAMYAVGVLRPPGNISVLPLQLVRALGALEHKVAAHPPFLNWGRFFVLDLERVRG